MEKLVLLCLLFICSNSFYAQDKTTKNKTKAKTEKIPTSKKDVENEAKKESKNSMSDKGVEKSTAGKSKAATNKADAKVKDKNNEIEKKESKVKEINEKPKEKVDKVTGEYKGKKVYTGSKGGKYYINSNGNKTYIQD